MTKTLVIHATFTVEGFDEPELTVMRRVPWPDGATLVEVAEAEIEKACREHHQPRVVDDHGLTTRRWT